MAIEVLPIPPLLENTDITLHLDSSLNEPAKESYIFFIICSNSERISGYETNSLAPALISFTISSTDGFSETIKILQSETSDETFVIKSIFCSAAVSISTIKTVLGDEFTISKHDEKSETTPLQSNSAVPFMNILIILAVCKLSDKTILETLLTIQEL